MPWKDTDKKCSCGNRIQVFIKAGKSVGRQCYHCGWSIGRAEDLMEDVRGKKRRTTGKLTKVV